MKRKSPQAKNSSGIRILVIHGPNLNLLGTREPDIYGSFTLDEINEDLTREAEKRSISLETRHSNHEGEIVDWIGQSPGKYDGLLINPAAYTHTSVAIRDALQAITIPAVEVHLSNIYRREDFRRVSLTAAACAGQVSGFGKNSYLLGLSALADVIRGRLS
jgi:3-dehydroquinate dehydratase-2